MEYLFDDFLRFFYPDADHLFDMERGFEYLDKELEQLFPPEDDVYEPRYVDKLVKVFARNGAEEWVLVHVEVQGYADKDFAGRMFQYYLRILDKYNKPVTAFAIFADAGAAFHPQYYERQYLGTSVYYEFNTFKIVDQNDAVLKASNNPFAIAVLAAKLAINRMKLGDEQVFYNARELVKFLLSKQMAKEKIRKVISFLRYYVRFEKQEMLVKFVEEIEILTGRTNTMGIEELLLDMAEKKGLKKGIEKGMTQKEEEKNLTFTRNLLSSTNFSITKIAELVGVSEAFVLDIKKDLGL